jgi:hypothetical protein
MPLFLRVLSILIFVFDIICVSSTKIIRLTSPLCHFVPFFVVINALKLVDRSPRPNQDMDE